MFVHTVIMVIEPHMKQGRQHKLISTIFLATSVTKKLDHNNLIIAGCWVHARRRFDEALAVVPKESRKESASFLIIKQIQAIYEVLY